MPSHHLRRDPPLWHDGTARPLPRPQDPTAQTTGDSGKTTRHLRTHRLRITAARRRLLRPATPPEASTLRAGPPQRRRRGRRAVTGGQTWAGTRAPGREETASKRRRSLAGTT